MKSLILVSCLLLAGIALCLAQEEPKPSKPFDAAQFIEVLQFFGPDFPCYMCEQIASLQNDEPCPHLKEAGLEGHCKQIATDYLAVRDSQTPKDYCKQLKVCQESTS